MHIYIYIVHVALGIHDLYVPTQTPRVPSHSDLCCVICVHVKNLGYLLARNIRIFLPKLTLFRVVHTNEQALDMYVNSKYRCVKSKKIQCVNVRS